MQPALAPARPAVQVQRGRRHQPQLLMTNPDASGLGSRGAQARSSATADWSSQMERVNCLVPCPASAASARASCNSINAAQLASSAASTYEGTESWSVPAMRAESACTPLSASGATLLGRLRSHRRASRKPRPEPPRPSDQSGDRAARRFMHLMRRTPNTPCLSFCPGRPALSFCISPAGVRFIPSYRQRNRGIAAVISPAAPRSVSGYQGS